MSPKALPPVSSMPLIFGAVAIGSKRAISFVPGAPPLISTDATKDLSEISVVHPVLFSLSVPVSYTHLTLPTSDLV